MQGCSAGAGDVLRDDVLLRAKSTNSTREAGGVEPPAPGGGDF